MNTRPSQSYRPRPSIGIWGSLSSSHSNPSPRYFTSPHHQYVYISNPWVDDLGRRWEAGYYNETGAYAQNLNNPAADSPFESSVLCECEYCGHSAVYNAEKMDEINLTCPNCGATMKVSSFQDKITETNNSSYINRSTSDYDERAVERTRSKTKFLIILVMLFFFLPYFLGVFKSMSSHQQNYQPVEYQENYQYPSASNPEIFGNTIYLARNSSGAYSIVTDSSKAEYTLEYDRYEDSYYCQELDEWFWHNTDVVPSVWQYWKESISGDYGDYGWMEHDSDGWWIEESNGNWVSVPSHYDTSRLIYIE